MWLSKVVVELLFLLFANFEFIVSSERASLFDRFALNSSLETAAWHRFFQNDEFTGNLLGLKNIFLEIPMEIDSKITENVIIRLMTTSVVTLFGAKDEQASKITAKYAKRHASKTSTVDYYFLIAKDMENIEKSFQYWKSLDSWNFQADFFGLVLDSKEINIKLFLMEILSFLRSNVRFFQMTTNSSISRIYSFDNSVIRRRPNNINGTVTVYEKCIDCNGRNTSQIFFEILLRRDDYYYPNVSYGQNQEKTLEIATQINEPFVFYSNGHLMGIDVDMTRNLAEFLNLETKFIILEKTGNISEIFNAG